MMQNSMAARFEAERMRLRSLAYRVLGSLSEAEDAVQESWLRLSRADAAKIANLGGWLTTVLARICLDMLRARRADREQPIDASRGGDPLEVPDLRSDPEQEALLAEEVGLALLVVLGTLAPAERVAFVLHDVFDLPFEDIAGIIGRSVEAARQLASRGRLRLRSKPSPEVTLNGQRAVVDAYLKATRARDLQALLAVLDPDAVLRLDAAVAPDGIAAVLRGADVVARRALGYPGRARFATPILIDGRLGIAVAPQGQLLGVMRLTIIGETITEIEVIVDRDRLSQLELAVVEPPA